MAYARMDGNSDVFVVRYTEVMGGKLACVACQLSHGRKSVAFLSPGEMLAHLADHAEQGHRVPAQAVNRLLRDHEQREREIGLIRTLVGTDMPEWPEL